MDLTSMHGARARNTHNPEVILWPLSNNIDSIRYKAKSLQKLNAKILGENSMGKCL